MKILNHSPAEWCHHGVGASEGQSELCMRGGGIIVSDSEDPVACLGGGGGWGWGSDAEEGLGEYKG